MRWATMMSVACLLAAVAAAPTAGAAPSTHEVAIEGMRFNPESLTVHRGDRIVWRKKDIVPHTATGTGTGGKVFDSHTIPAGGSWTFVAGRRGTLPYVCSMHPTMKGTLTVQ
jgi:plastocyanin